MKLNTTIILLRSIHGLFTLYFIFCIFYIYYAAITLTLSLFLWIAIFSLLIEGFLVFVLNGGHCPLIYFQKKINDPVPFFNLILPDTLAAKAIPFFSIIMFCGVILLLIRILMS